MERVGLIMLAAGVSRRFGADKRQARLPDGRTLMQASMEAVPAIFSSRVLVLHPGDESLAASIQGWHCVIAEKAAEGMGASLAAGIAAMGDMDGVLVALADMPWISSDSYELVRSALAPQRIIIPCFQGQRGHPVGFGQPWPATLGKLTGDKGARELIRSEPAAVLEVDSGDPGIVRDVDTSKALQQG